MGLMNMPLRVWLITLIVLSVSKVLNHYVNLTYLIIYGTLDLPRTFGISIRRAYMPITLTAQRRGEIAVVLLREVIRERGLRTLNKADFKREMHKIATDVGLPPAEVIAYVEQEVRAMVNDLFKTDFIPGKLVKWQ